MTRYDKRTQALAVGLSALAGYVDAIGFIQLRGFFVSFMSGNSTRLGVGLIEQSHDAAVAAGLIALFVAGVAAGSLVGRFAKTQRRPVVLMLVTLLLFVAASGAATGASYAAVIAMVLAMGAENAVFEHDGELHIGLTYMTGTLVKFGQSVASAIMGGPRFAWVSYGLLWAGLVAGAVAGAASYTLLGLASLWIAAVTASLFALTSRTL